MHQRAAFLLTAGLLSAPSLSYAQGWGAPPPSPPPPPPPAYSGSYPQNPYAAQQPAYGQPRKSSALEIGVLYATAAAWGVGLGVWVDAEADVEDPGLRVLPPILLGAAAPVGVFALDHPPMPEGLPAAISAGLFLGAGEGLGIAAYQHVSSSEHNEWGFLGLSRSVAFGSTLGGVSGYVIGYYAEPDPASTLMLSSGAVWGTLIGAALGYGASGEGQGYSLANDGAGLGGLIGFNSGLAVGGVLAFVLPPSFHQLGWMWIGAGLGAAVSAPFYLLYAPDDAPPAKRGLIITGTAMGVGVIAGALFGSGHVQNRLSSKDDRPAWARIVSVHPIAVEGGMGAGVLGQF